MAVDRVNTDVIVAATADERLDIDELLWHRKELQVLGSSRDGCGTRTEQVPWVIPYPTSKAGEENGMGNLKSL